MLILLAFLPTALAFTNTTTQYIAQQSIGNNIDVNCQDSFYQNLTSNTQAIQCLNNALDCEPKTTAQSYKQNAENSSGCDKTTNYATSIYNYINSQDPSNWQAYQEPCKIDFQQGIQDKITNFQSNWQQANECTDTITQEKYLMTFTSTDLNNLIQNTQNYYFPQAQNNTPITPNIPDTNDNEIRQLIKQMIDSNASPQEIAITAQVLNQTLNVQCLLATERKKELYENYKRLSDTAKQCLPYFTNLEAGTSYQLFINQCPALTVGNYTQNPMQNYYLAQSILDEYFQQKMAETQVSQYLMPSANGQAPYSYNITNYKPIAISGCITQWKTDLIQEGQNYNDGTIYTITIIIIVFIIIGLFIYLKDTSGNV